MLLTISTSTGVWMESVDVVALSHPVAINFPSLHMPHRTESILTLTTTQRSFSAFGQLNVALGIVRATLCMHIHPSTAVLQSQATHQPSFSMMQMHRII